MAKKYYRLLLGIGLAAQLQAADISGTEHAAVDELATAAADLQRTVAAAISQFEQRSRRDWAYRIERYENEEGDISSSIELYEPANAPDSQWQLLSINGRTPDKKLQRKFAAAKQQQAKEVGQQNFSVKLSELIQLDSLQLTFDSPQHLQASFGVYLSQLGEDVSKKLQGSLRFDKQQHYIDSIEISNTAHFSPLFSANISEFNLTLRFIKIDSAILPQQQQMKMKGTFAFFTQIDEVSTDTFSDYRYVGGGKVSD
ncbi:hypothetical protein HRH59_06060 [Rheinheimera sp. YQF-2]|uniref:Outer membrane lipoprotein-sorting protein n=1 Tax=Rheinheimera lutimaris TaxID=2740584 RepID=A0A7Y5EKI6_9GAMM|nr:hypothetical protein [Rheinheimera lutimaris]NRQ42133.1 hypothetical protein [Rheinheimera lutimaris]